MLPEHVARSGESVTLWHGLKINSVRHEGSSGCPSARRDGDAWGVEGGGEPAGSPRRISVASQPAIPGRLLSSRICFRFTGRWDYTGLSFRVKLGVHEMAGCCARLAFRASRAAASLHAKAVRSRKVKI